MQNANANKNLFVHRPTSLFWLMDDNNWPRPFPLHKWTTEKKKPQADAPRDAATVNKTTGDALGTDLGSAFLMRTVVVPVDRQYCCSSQLLLVVILSQQESSLRPIVSSN
jgi:hypothetical protein